MNWLDNVKKIKKEKGYTNEALSELSGISLGTLNKLLSGASEDPKLSTLMTLSASLGVSLDDMLGLGDDSVIDSELAKKYSELDRAGRETVDYIINKEYARVSRERESKPYSLENPKVRRIKLFNTAASAGTGSYLSDSDSTEIAVYSNPITDSADFAVRVSGDSMMPKYHDGDILLAEQTDRVDEGELGIFSLNGESFFKKFGGDCLISLNPEYQNIKINAYDDIVCFGKVIGRLRK
ncbi:MAG: helix-turn-helix domain-containing protein [Clostridiales bacterium]|nr:helix-turn-helix domain-containing protein [Clostridiales bacterium]